MLLAPDGFGSPLPSTAATAAIAAGWRAGAPHDDVLECPLADGGPGFVDTLHRVLGGRLLPVVVRGPWGEPVPATVLLVGDTIYVESAQAAGLALVPAGRRDPTRTTTLGVGDLLREARATGARRVVVGLGGPATADAGMGMLAALGGGDEAGRLAGGGGGLPDVTGEDLAGLAALRDDWAGVDVVAAGDVDAPLLGLQGASAALSPRTGATPEQAQRLERAMAHVARLAVAALGPDARPSGAASSRTSLPLATGRPAADRFAALPGAGAGGGLGFGLALLGARLLPGAAVVADAVGLDEKLAASDVAVTGAGRFDWQSLHGTVVGEVAGRALAHGVPTVVVAGEVLVGRREQAAAGISGAYAVSSSPAEREAALADPAGTLEARAAAVARTWSPAPR